MTPLIQAIVFIAMGLVAIIGIYLRMKKSDILIKNGIVVEGIIFDMDTSTSGWGSIEADSSTNYPTIRFVTKDGIWITKQYDIGVSRPLIKPGQKLKMIYDPSNPENFVIDSGVFKWVLYPALFVGFGFFAYGAYQLVQLL